MDVLHEDLNRWTKYAIGATPTALGQGLGPGTDTDVDADPLYELHPLSDLYHTPSRDSVFPTTFALFPTHFFLFCLGDLAHDTLSTGGEVGVVGVGGGGHMAVADNFSRVSANATKVLRRLLGQAKGQPSTTSHPLHPHSQPRRTVSIQVRPGEKTVAAEQGLSLPLSSSSSPMLEGGEGLGGGEETHVVVNNNNSNNDDTNDSSAVGVVAVASPGLLDQGQVAWQQHLQRNRSCVVDLFQGQLCSVVTCNECGSISRTYDPFTSLSLPLATHHDITVTVTVVRHMPRLSTSAIAEMWYQHR